MTRRSRRRQRAVTTPPPFHPIPPLGGYERLSTHLAHTAPPHLTLKQEVPDEVGFRIKGLAAIQSESTQGSIQSHNQSHDINRHRTQTSRLYRHNKPWRPFPEPPVYRPRHRGNQEWIQNSHQQRHAVHKRSKRLPRYPPRLFHPNVRNYVRQHNHIVRKYGNWYHGLYPDRYRPNYHNHTTTFKPHRGLYPDRYIPDYRRHAAVSRPFHGIYPDRYIPDYENHKWSSRRYQAEDKADGRREDKNDLALIPQQTWEATIPSRTRNVLLCNNRVPMTGKVTNEVGKTSYYSMEIGNPGGQPSVRCHNYGLSGVDRLDDSHCKHGLQESNDRMNSIAQDVTVPLMTFLVDTSFNIQENGFSLPTPSAKTSPSQNTANIMTKRMLRVLLDQPNTLHMQKALPQTVSKISTSGPGPMPAESSRQHNGWMAARQSSFDVNNDPADGPREQYDKHYGRRIRVLGSSNFVGTRKSASADILKVCTGASNRATKHSEVFMDKENIMSGLGQENSEYPALEPQFFPGAASIAQLKTRLQTSS